MFEGDEAQIRKDHEENLSVCDAVLFYYGEGNELWLRQKLREVQKSAAFGRKKPIVIKAIYVAPPDSPSKAQFRTREAMVIDQRGPFDPAALSDFISQLHAKLMLDRRLLQSVPRPAELRGGGRPLFFGRESRIDEILTRLRRSRFLSVVGTSGSGKSSLDPLGTDPVAAQRHDGQRRIELAHRASSVPAKIRSATWRRRSTSPDVIGAGSEPADTSQALLESTLRRSQLGPGRMHPPGAGPDAREHPDHRRPVRRAVPLQEQPPAARVARRRRRLREAAARSGQPAAELRSTSSSRCGRTSSATAPSSTGLTEAINDGQYLVPRMNREERRSAITGPVAVGGAEISPRLVLRLLNDVGDDPDQLPILQHAMMRTWEYWQTNHAEGEPIDLNHYEAIGTMTEALSRHAEETFLELDTPERKLIAERMFKALTDRGSDARGVRSPRPARRALRADRRQRGGSHLGHRRVPASRPQLPDAAGRRRAARRVGRSTSRTKA